VPPTEATRSKYILRVISIAAPVKISSCEGGQDCQYAALNRSNRNDNLSRSG
jgi:hypothetical protein